MHNSTLDLFCNNEDDQFDIDSAFVSALEECASKLRNYSRLLHRRVSAVTVEKVTTIFPTVPKIVYSIKVKRI